MRIVVLFLARSYALIKPTVRAEFDVKWTVGKSCGTRPQGPFYPAPIESSDNSTETNCEIEKDAKYRHGYKCIAQCQNS